MLNVLIDGTLAHCVTGSAVLLFGQGFFTICSNVTQSCMVFCLVLQATDNMPVLDISMKGIKLKKCYKCLSFLNKHSQRENS